MTIDGIHSVTDINQLHNRVQLRKNNEAVSAISASNGDNVKSDPVRKLWLTVGSIYYLLNFKQFQFLSDTSISSD